MEGFQFTDCIEIKELTAKKANDESEFLELIEEASPDSIYFHTHSYFLRHFYIMGPYPSDFANWIVLQVRDRVLGEKLSALTPSGKQSIEDVRSDLIEVIDDHLSSIKTVPAVSVGQPFHLMKSKIIEIPTRLRAQSLQEFRDGLAAVDASAVYNHIFEARLRGRRGRSDFSIWFEEVLGLSQLASDIEQIDAYMYSLEGLREKILFLCDRELQKGGQR